MLLKTLVLMAHVVKEKIVVFVMSEILENYYRVHELGLEMNCCLKVGQVSEFDRRERL